MANPLRLLRRFSINGILLGIILLMSLVGANMWTYSKLLHEEELAELDIQQISEQLFRVRFTDNEGREQIFELTGDEWQVDVRLIRWRSWLTLLGNDPLYRLDRITGRYTELQQERDNPTSVFPLTNNPGIDLWALSRKHGNWLPGVEAVYGSSVYLPMVHAGRYSLLIGATGLSARAVNNAAENAILNWPW